MLVEVLAWSLGEAVEKQNRFCSPEKMMGRGIAKL